jgi:hypothetical protein
MTHDLETLSIPELCQILGERILRTARAATDPNAPPEKWHKDAVRYFQHLRDCKASLSLEVEPRP